MEQGGSGRDLAFGDAQPTGPSGALNPVEGTDPRVQAIVAALSQRHRVVVPSAEPIEDLARAVWSKLPCWVRRRASVATWAFRNDNRFDLVALPQRPATSTTRRSSCWRPRAMTAEATRPRRMSDQAYRPSLSWKQRWGCLVPMVGLTVLSAGFAWWRFPRPEPVEAIANPARPKARAFGPSGEPASRFPPRRERNRSSAPKVGGGSTRRSRTFSSDSIQPARRRPFRGRSSIGPGPRSRTHNSSRR